MKTQVLIIFDSTQRSSQEAMAQVKGKLIHLVSDKKYQMNKDNPNFITLPTTIYHFIDIVNRNLKNFFDKNGKMNHIYFLIQDLTSDLLLKLNEIYATNPKVSVGLNVDSYDLFAIFKKTFAKVNVYELKDGDKEYEEVYIFNYEVTPENHFINVKEVMQEMRIRSKMKLDNYQKQMRELQETIIYEEEFYKKIK
jgi:hypothetical protein